MSKELTNEELTYRENLRIGHSSACQKYEELAKNLKQALERFLNDADIEVLDVQYRIKDFLSFWEKIQRKGYEDPLQEVEDICGLRIICYYPSDLDRISSLINREFNVLESMNKVGLLEPDKFGYRSIHFIVIIKDDWLHAPNYRGLDSLKAEIQVRTVLMHAWADIEQKLAYKKKEYVPDRLRRRLSRLSAMFEEADEQLASLIEEREEYREYLLSDEVKRSGRFDVTQELNLDSLQAFLDYYFPDRQKSVRGTSSLLDEVIEQGVSIKDLVEGYETIKDFLPNMEEEIFRNLRSKEQSKRRALKIKWAQIGIVRQILDMTHDGYWQYRKEVEEVPEHVVEHVENWRAKLSK